MEIVIGADICVTESNRKYFSSGNISELIGEELQSVLFNVDYRIFNLEGPITNSDNAIVKNGPNIKMPLDSINGLKNLNPSLLTLANNHILDYGESGYDDTEKVLKSNNIDFIGVGRNSACLEKERILEKAGIKIGVYACAEHEFSIARENYPGANPYSGLYTFDDIQNLKKKCDYLIVLYHGGIECYRYPSPLLRERFRKMAEKGANLVIAQHTHCIGCKESFNESELVFGQGNFIFDDGNDEFWNSGLLLKVTIEKKSGNVKQQIAYIPYIKTPEGKIRLANKADKEKLLKDFFTRSEKIKENTFVEKEFKNFANNRFAVYLDALHGDNFIYKVFRKLFGLNFVYKLYSKPYVLNKIKNFLECESHYETLLSGLNNISKF